MGAILLMIFSNAFSIKRKVFTLTHWGRVTHICIGELTIVGSNNGLSPGRRQAIIWTNAVILLIGPLGTNFNEILIEIHIFLFKKMHLKMSSGKWGPFCLGLNVLMKFISKHQVENKSVLVRALVWVSPVQWCLYASLGHKAFLKKSAHELLCLAIKHGIFNP